MALTFALSRLPLSSGPSRRAVLLGGAAVGVVAVGAAAWTVLASSLFLMGVGGQPMHGSSPSYEWWDFAWNFPRNFRRWPEVQRWLRISGVAAAVPIAGMWVGAIRFAWRHRAHPRSPLAWARGTKLVRGTSENHGKAAWPDLGKALRDFAPGRGPYHIVMAEAVRIDQSSVADVRFNPRDERTWGPSAGPLLVDNLETGSGHSMFIGGSGAGKSTAGATRLFHWRGNAVVMDPKGEIERWTRAAREAMGQRVLTIGPGLLGLDTLAAIDITAPSANRQILSLVGSVCGEEADRSGSPDSIFDDAGRNIFAALLADFLWEEPPAEDRTLATFIDLLTTPEVEMRTLLDGIGRDSKSSLARRAARSVPTAEDTFSGAYFNAVTLTKWLTDDAVAGVVSGDALKPGEITRGPLTIYLRLPMDVLKFSSGVARTLLDTLAWEFIKADGDVFAPTLFMPDEPSKVGRMTSFELIRDVGRHYRAHIHLPHLTEAEIDAVWGTRGKSGCELWYSNLSWRCYAAIADNDAARRLVERCGKHGVMAASEGTNTGSSSGMNTNTSRSRGKNASYHEIARELITVDEIQALRDDDLILLPRGYRPIRCRVPHFFRHPELRALAGLPPLESADVRFSRWVTRFVQTGRLAVGRTGRLLRARALRG
jgi:type IV secretion system protein VirD4